MGLAFVREGNVQSLRRGLGAVGHESQRRGVIGVQLESLCGMTDASIEIHGDGDSSNTGYDFSCHASRTKRKGKEEIADWGATRYLYAP